MDYYIYKRKDNRYEGRLKIGKKADGKVQYKYLYACSYEDCIAKIEKFVNFCFKEDEVLFTAKLKFQDISCQWLLFTKTYIKESTCAIYNYVLKRYLNPVFGKKEMYLIDENMINQFVNDLLTKGAINSNKPLSTTTVCNIVVILKMIFVFAENRYMIANPTKNIRINKIKNEKKFLSDKHWQAICWAAQKEITSTTIAISIAAYMGLRIGEICALQKKDIDFNNNYICISKTVQRINYAKDIRKTKLVIGEPKTQNSRRCVPIPDILIERLKIFCKSYLSEDFLFGTRNTALDPRTLQYRFKNFLQKNNIPEINFHQLRHKFAGSCVENNIDIKVLSEILGHSNVSVTLNYYVHPTMDFKRKQLNMAVKKR